MEEVQKTFDKLRQTPIDDMVKIVESIKRPPPIFTLGGHAPFERTHFYPEVVFYLERMACLKEHGWEPDDFYMELEKRSIIQMVEEYNNNLAFPQDFIDRVKKIFPNVKFTPAKLELE